MLTLTYSSRSSSIQKKKMKRDLMEYIECHFKAFFNLAGLTERCRTFPENSSANRFAKSSILPASDQCRPNTSKLVQVLFSTTRFSNVLRCEGLNFVSSPQCKYMNFIYLKSTFITWTVYLDPTH